MTKKALLLSGYHSISQAHWATFISDNINDFSWTQIALPPRYFSWRMRGNPLSIAANNTDALNESYDLILATSSIDLSVIQSIYPALRNTRSILYFHENQFAYPTNNQPKSIVDCQMVNLYSALRADKLVFNSQYNLDSFISGLTKLLRKLPDLVPKNIPQQLTSKSTILPVPISPSTQQVSDKREVNAPCKVLWNHRWEWDKCPELLLETAKLLRKKSVNVKLVITGEQFRNIPAALTLLCEDYSELLDWSGFIDNKETYQNMLTECDIILSTAIHEFQGIAVLEAVEHNCTPLLPNRLSYPEMFDQLYLYDAQGTIAEQAASAVEKIIRWIETSVPAAPDVSKFHTTNLTEHYKHMLE